MLRGRVAVLSNIGMINRSRAVRPTEDGHDCSEENFSEFSTCEHSNLNENEGQTQRVIADDGAQNGHLLKVHRQKCVLFSQSRCFSSVRTSSKLKNYYDILGVTPSCSKDKIKKAYYRLSKVYHPDINKTELAQKKFQEISEAYEILINVKTRQMYDEARKGRSRTHDTRTHHGQAPFKHRGMPPTGRSSKYNFDEWYKRHYSETFERKMVDRQKYKEYKERESKVERNEAMYKSQSSYKDMDFLVAFTALAIMIGAYFFKR